VTEAESRRRVRVVNRDGVHARPCAQISSLVRRSKSKVRISGPLGVADAASVLELMTLALAPGVEAEIAASGPDAERVMAALVAMFDAAFGEERA
jgi:phosphotransferase system HPr (HPr) family protein